MELIYAYIETYRLFKKQQINFSNKFKVNYEQGKLTIEKNKDYVNIYPEHITNISAIVGKNASGKTSLLDLIGQRIETRYHYNEIYKEKKKDPHEKDKLVKAKYEKSELSSDYFLIYYLGKGEDLEDLFVFESCNAKEHLKIFENDHILTEKQIHNSQEELEPKVNYFYEKGWLPYIFKKNEENLVLLNDLQEYNMYFCNNIDNITDLTSITVFRKNFLENFCYRKSLKSDDESKICIKRHYCKLQADTYYKQINFLIKMMNEKNVLYKNDYYDIIISLYDEYIFFEEDYSKLNKNEKEKPFYKEENIDKFYTIIKDYKDLDEKNTYSEKEKLILYFIHGYLCYAFKSIVNYSYTMVKGDNDYNCIKSLQNNQIKNNPTYNDFITYYYKQLEILFNYINVENVNIDEFKKVQNALEKLYDKQKEANIELELERHKIIFKINKNSKIGTEDEINEVKEFFENFLDEKYHKDEKEVDSIIQNYFSVDILPLSDGEKENLAMFTAIDEQITMYTKNKNNYILLFDEIERSMHPEMCRQLIKYMINFLSYYKDKKFQIIIATHSPFILSDILKENVVCLEKGLNKNHNDDGKDTYTSIVKKSKINTFGQNIYTLLKNEFFLDSIYGDYFSSKITEINNFINDEDYKSYKYVKKLKEYEFIIDNIGELVLKNYFKKAVKECKDKYYKSQSVQERIDYYEQEIKKLKSLQEKE